jgi:hypothetical protein
MVLQISFFSFQIIQQIIIFYKKKLFELKTDAILQ